MSRRKDITGRRFGHLTALRLHHVRKQTIVQRTYLWLYRCDCGREVVRPTRDLAPNSSCGCSRITTRKHGASAKRARNGRRGKATVEYGVWCGMRARCKYPQFKDYAGRGITICKRWDDFSAFLADMGPRPSPRHSLERIDNNRGYEPDNCKWGTKTDQNRNKRNNRRVTYAGETLTLVEWAERTRLPYDALKRRLYAGWPVELALTIPVPAPRLRNAVGDRFAPGRGKQFGKNEVQ